MNKLYILLACFLMLGGLFAGSISVSDISATKTKIADYSYKTTLKNGTDVSIDTVKNKIDKATNTLLDCDALTCDYRVEVTAKQSLTFDATTLKGLYIGEGVSVQKIFYEIINSKTTKQCNSYIDGNTSKNITSCQNITTYTTTENTDITKPFTKDEVRTYVIRFVKDNTINANGKRKYNNTVVDIYHEIFGQERKDAGLWNSTGGTVTYDGSYTVVTFTSNGTFNVTGEINATVLVVAGGGGGRAGGGGAGGLIYNTSYSATGNISVVVGGGGAGGSVDNTGGCATNGQNSTFGTLTAVGGGGGANSGNGAGVPAHGCNGGSGGGGGEWAYTTSNGGNGTAGQGNNGGGNGGYVASPYPAGGGGGAGAIGNNASSNSVAGDGGAGLNYSINGTNMNYSCGGGGGLYFSGTAGSGGCKFAGNGSSSGTGGTATANTGSGGGGAPYLNSGGAGGSGIVIVRYLTYNETKNNTYANLTVNAGVGGTAVGNATNLNTTTGINSSINATPNTGYKFSNWSVTSGNCTIANSTNNQTTANFLNTTSNCVVQANFRGLSVPFVGNFTNASTSHSFTVNGSVNDTEGGTDIASVNFTTSAGSCSYMSNDTTGNTFRIKYNCTSTSPATANITIGFTDGVGNYLSNSSTNAYPDHGASLTAPTITPTTIYTVTTATCNMGTFSDIDGDTENVSARTYAWQYNGAATGITTVTFDLNAFGANNSANVSCSIVATNSTWTTSNATNMSANKTITPNYSPQITIQNTFTNSTVGHSFTVFAGAVDTDAGDSIAFTNITTTFGTCTYVSNTTSGGAMNVTYLCNSTASGTTNITIRFTDAIAGAYNTTTSSNNTYPDHAPTLTAPAITPTLAHLNDTLTCNPGTFSDVDGDTENVSARAWKWYVNGVLTAVTQTLPSGAFTTYDNITCQETATNSSWVLTTTTNSTVFTSVLGFYYTSYGNTSGVVGFGKAFDYSKNVMTTATGNADAFGLLIMATIFIGFYIIGSRYTQERALVYATFVTTVVAFLLVSGNFLNPNWLILSIIALLAAIYFANRVG